MTSKQEVATFELNCYPNPVSKYATITCRIPKAGTVSVSVLSVDGRLQKKVYYGNQQKGNHQFQFDINPFKDGIYLYQINFNGINRTGKMIIRKEW